jgi:hypothetical protein
MPKAITLIAEYYKSMSKEALIFWEMNSEIAMNLKYFLLNINNYCLRGNIMNTNSDLNLSTLFRPNLQAHTKDVSNIKQEFLSNKYEKSEHHASVFLLDQKYTLNLDELV